MNEVIVALVLVMISLAVVHFYHRSLTSALKARVATLESAVASVIDKLKP